MNWSVFPCICFAVIFVLLGYAIYSDHQYKMKKLELIEKGLLKEEK